MALIISLMSRFRNIRTCNVIICLKQGINGLYYDVCARNIISVVGSLCFVPLNAMHYSVLIVLDSVLNIT